MKYRINDIYEDGYTLIEDNPLLNNDTRLADLLERATDMDILIENEFGGRELFKTLLKEDNDEIYTYNLPKIYRSIYAVFLANMTKYNLILSTLEAVENFNPSSEYGETKVYGDREKETLHGAQSTTNTYGNVNKTLTHGAQSTTNTYGNVNKEISTGASTDSTTNGQRQNTSAVSPSFGSSSFANTEQDTTAQVIDSTTYGSRTDSEQTTRGNDTTSHATYTDQDATVRGQDTSTRATFTDIETQPETIDTITGYKNLLKNLEQKYNVGSRLDFIKLVCNDVANQITYNLYL